MSQTAQRNIECSGDKGIVTQATYPTYCESETMMIPRDNIESVITRSPIVGTAPGCFSLYIPRQQPATILSSSSSERMRTIRWSHVLTFPEQNIRIAGLAKRSDTVLAGHSPTFLGFEVICYLATSMQRVDHVCCQEPPRAD